MPMFRQMLLSLFALILAAAALPSPLFAQTAPPPAAGARVQRPAALLRGPFGPIASQVRRAQLTPAQRQQMLGIFKAHQPELRALAEKTQAARARWQQAGQISIQERKDLADQRAAVMKQVRTEVFALLTPEQQKRVLGRRPPVGR